MGKTIFTLAFVIAIVVFGLYLGYSFKSGPKNPQTEGSFNINEVPTNSTTNIGANGGTSVSATSTAPSQQANVYFERKTGDATEVVLYDFSQNKPRVFFTDKDEEQKVKFSSRSGDNVLIGVANKQNPEETDLYNVTLDGKGQKTIIAEKLNSMQTITLSPDKTKVALVAFSNAEKDFGFSLNVYDLNSKKTMTLTKDPDGVYTPSFSDNNTILYVSATPAQGKTQPKFGLRKIDLGSKNIETIYETDTKINAFKKVDNGYLISEGGKENKIKIYNTDSKKTEEIYTTKNPINSLEKINATQIVFNENGQLTLYDLSKKETTKLGGDNIILGK